METLQKTLKSPRKLKKISAKHIQAVVEQITSTYDPEKIILFGSYAYGKPHAWSDLDLLVIMDAPKGELETALAMRKMLPPYPFSIDILVRSAKTIEKRKALGDGFLQEITQQGKVVYERIDA
ncbi:MAG: nucleotidyltransferase domain-containing protein [Anaerolineales bacterium]